MDSKRQKTAIENLENALEKLENKKFKMYFLVYDTKGTPSGGLSYIYETAMFLHNNGYDVQMLHNEKEFVGVKEWLGDEYADLPHRPIEKSTMSPADFLFIPEVFTSMMAQTKTMPCKRVVILQNTNYLCDTISAGGTFEALKIRDCITTSNTLKSRLQVWFPELQINVVRPSVPEYFKPSDKPKKLIVNIVSKTMNDINTIVKPFFWKYPNYKWVSFYPVQGCQRQSLANSLSKSSILLWIDDKTDFGHTAIEAMACKNIIIGKMPENEPEWLLDDNGVARDSGLWFYKNDIAIDMLASVIETLINDEVPERIYEEMENTVKEYTQDKQNADITEVYGNLIENRKKELNLALVTLKNNILKETEE